MNAHVKKAGNWLRSLPYLLTVIEDGTDAAKAQAREELRRMAQAADAFSIIAEAGAK